MARIRITIDCDEAYKRAFLARAAVRGLSPQEFFQELVEESCPDELQKAKLDMGEDEPPRKAPRR